jgi:hypothetical protein
LKLHSGASAHVQLTGIGKITDLDCGYEPFPEPYVPPRTCTPEHMFNAADVTSDWF